MALGSMCMFLGGGVPLKILYKAKHGGVCLEKPRQEDHGAEANLDCPVPSDFFFFVFTKSLFCFCFYKKDESSLRIPRKALLRDGTEGSGWKAASFKVWHPDGCAFQLPPSHRGHRCV